MNRVMGAKLTLDLPYFVCEDTITTHLARVFEGEYDVPLVYTNEQPIVLDLGANFGAFSVWASHRWPGCSVYSYEPNPEIFPDLERNVSFYSGVKAFNQGVGTPGMRVLGKGLENTGERSFHRVANNPAPLGQHCEVIDPLSLPVARVIKLDIEGCETEVLVPLIESGRTFDAIMFEFHNREIRLRLEDLLRKDYVLTGASLYSPDLGVLRFLNRKVLK